MNQELLDQISIALQKGKAKDIKVLVQQAIDEGMPAETILDFAALPDIERDTVERALFKLDAGFTRIEKGIDDKWRALCFVPCLALQSLEALLHVDGIEGHVDLLC